jgi:nitrilase
MTTMTRTITICTIQPAVSFGHPERTFERISTLLVQATAGQAVDIAVLPEHFNAVMEGPGETGQWEAATAFAAGLARHHRVHLVAGSVEHWEAERQLRLNTALVFDRTGQAVGSYDKRMLFGFEQQRGVAPGRGALVLEIEEVRCGVLICSDLWYPDLVRELAGAIDVLCVPAQTTIRPQSDPAYARLLWHGLALVRAQENVIAVAVSDQATTSEAPYRCGGVSAIVDPSAEPELEAIRRTMDDGAEGYLVATIDLERLDAFRQYRRANGLLP